LPDGYSGFAFSFTLQGPQKITIPASIDGFQLVVNVSAAVTAGWPAGEYKYQLQAVLGDDRHVVSQGFVRIDPDFDQLPAGVDVRSHAQQMLDAINKVLLGRIDKDVEAYEIAGRSITRIPVLELQQLKRQYMKTVLQERRKAQGQPSFRPIPVRSRFRT
jgi:hypothetical protein